MVAKDGQCARMHRQLRFLDSDDGKRGLLQEGGQEPSHSQRPVRLLTRIEPSLLFDRLGLLPKLRDQMTCNRTYLDILDIAGQRFQTTNEVILHLLVPCKLFEDRQPVLPTGPRPRPVCDPNHLLHNGRDAPSWHEPTSPSCTLAAGRSPDTILATPRQARPGGLAEWSNAAVLKTVVARATGGSNPSPSARPPAPRRTQGVETTGEMAEWSNAPAC